jgi:hypothetical protein
LWALTGALAWPAATAVSFAGVAPGSVFEYFANADPLEMRLRTFLGTLAGGAMLGLGQWLLLRRYAGMTWWWVPVTAMGYVADRYLGVWAALAQSLLLRAVRNASPAAAYGVPAEAPVWTFVRSDVVSAIPCAVAARLIVRRLMPRASRRPQVPATVAGFSLVWPVVVLALDALWALLAAMGSQAPDQPLSVRLARSVLSAVVAGTVAGVSLGTVQWLILRRYARRAGWWMVGTAAGWGLGSLGYAVLLFGAAPTLGRSGLSIVLLYQAVPGAIAGVLGALVMNCLLRQRAALLRRST